IQFAETDYSISVIKPAHRGQLSPHSAGQLQCSTKEHADTFNCSFAINACQCTHGLYKASCSCSSGSVADLMQPSPLPLVSKNFKIFSEDKKVYARTNIGSALQLHIVAENMKITARQSNSTCTIEASDLVGCYNCIAGAELTLYCQSSGTETTANIECQRNFPVAALRGIGGALNAFLEERVTQVHKKLTKEAIIFPNSLIMYDYTVSIKAYENDKLRHNGHVSCKAHPICETLRCTFCWKRIYNSQCWTLLGNHVLHNFATTLRHTDTMCGTVAICKLHRKSPNLRRYTSRRRKLRTRKSLLHLSKGCSQVVSMNAHEEICIISNDIETCTFNEAMVVTLQPLQQETCIALKDHESQPIGVISVKINGILFQCRRNVEFFTRDHQLVSESVHRCYSAGTCDRSTCENMSPTEKSKEFSFEANNNPGYTFCTPSCGCLTCDGCFLSDHFDDLYNIYMPKLGNCCHIGSNAPAKRFDRINYNSTSPRSNFRLEQSQVQSHRDSRPPTTNIVVDIRGNRLLHLMRDSFKCSTKEHADTFNCSFAINACQCTHGLYKASCSCSSGSVADLMQPSPLPLVSKNFKIFSEDKKVYARTNIGSALQLHIVAENMKITARQSNSTCTIEASDLVGCYNCIAGAELTLYCQSSGTETTANIECPSQTQMALCTSSGYLNILKFHFDTSSVSMICNASCPGGTVSLAVKGVLLYVDDDLIRDNLQSEAKTRDLPRDTTFLSQIPNKFKEFVGKIPDLLPINFLTKAILSFLLTVLVMIMIIRCISRSLMLAMTPKFSKKHH
ncbi:hypothetical protein OSTOST_08055, partial [Ostertagia ostertagi]